MAKKWILGVVVLAVVLGGLFLFGFIPGDSSGSDMEIIFYDADGNELGRTDTRLSTLGIRAEGFEGDIYSLKVVVYFRVTTDIDYIGIDTRCWLTVITREGSSPRGTVAHSVAEHRLGPANTDLEGTFYDTYLMSDLLPASAITEAGKLGSWYMRFSARVETTVGKQDGTTKTVEDTCGTTLILSWVEGLELESWFGNW